MSRASELANKATRELGDKFDRTDCFYSEGLMADMRDELRRLDRVNAELVEGLRDAGRSLKTISLLAGRKAYGNPPIETYMSDFVQVRGYANSRATAAIAALTSATKETK